MGSLKNHILIAMSHMSDPYFGKSVILICEHSKEGAMGLIINRPFQEPNLKKLFADIYSGNDDILKIVPKVYFGGPVMIERGIVLHSTEHSIDGTLNISSDFSITSHKEILEDISEGIGPKQFKLYLGHAGWSAGQLEQEIERGDWLLQSTTHDFVFNVPEKYMWTQANKTFGIDTTQITGVGGLA
jgi:putative transcriptional regulator